MKKIALFFLFLTPLNLATGAGTGTAVFDFLKLDLGARAAALGGAMGAVLEDADAMQYNPASLASLKTNQLTFMHNEYFDDVTQQYASLSNKKGFGLSVNRVDFGNFQRTTFANPSGIGLDSVEASDLALTLGLGRELSPLIDVGVNFKYIRETLDERSVDGGVADLGLLAHFGKENKLTIGGSIQNLGSKVKFNQKEEDLPVIVRGDASLKLRLNSTSLLLTGSLSQQAEEDMKFAGGAELLIAKTLAFRGGYNSRNEAGTGITVGGGIRLFGNTSLDYAFVPFGDLDDSHRVSITLQF